MSTKVQRCLSILYHGNGDHDSAPTNSLLDIITKATIQQPPLVDETNPM